MDVMEHLAADLSCALEDSKTKKVRGWKHRRSRSTSNLMGNVPKTDTGSESSDDNKSELAERSFARLSLQSKSCSSKYLKHRLPTAGGNVVESDSLNELFGGSSQMIRAETKRRRRHKRMAVDTSDLLESDFHDGERACSSMTAVIPKHPSSHRSKKKTGSQDRQATVDVGKRKRGHSNRANEATSGDPFIPGDTSSGAMDMEVNDEDMKSDFDETSSVFSSSESDSFQVTCDEGQEGDDEHSDWVGDEWLNEEGCDNAERRRDLIMRKLLDHAPFREIRAGKRRVHPNKPVFSFRTSANEQLSKFLQDPDQSELKLHPMRKSERLQLSHIANLYSLQMHCRVEDDGQKSLTCPVLTKTSNTAQMDPKSVQEDILKASSIPLWFENETKRIKK